MIDSLVLFALPLGMLETNAYLLGDHASGDAILIDPVDDAPLIVQTAADAGLTIKLIVATHAHFDHVLASRELKELTGAPFVLHKEALPQLHKLAETTKLFLGIDVLPAAEPDRLIGADGEWIEAGALRLQTLNTPGHAPGHIALYLPSHRVVFSGDALFAGAVGRWDLPGADKDTLLHSIHTRLLTLEDDVQVLPGHGSPTTIGVERRENPYLQ